MIFVILLLAAILGCHCDLTVDSIVVLEVLESVEYAGLYHCKTTKRKRGGNKIVISGCTCERGYGIEPVAGFESGRKVVRWSVRNGGLELYRTTPLMGEMTPPTHGDSEFTFRLMLWEDGAEEFCNEVVGSGVELERSERIELLGDVVLNAKDKVFPHQSMEVLLGGLTEGIRGRDCRWASLRVSLLFGEWSFEEAKRTMDNVEGCEGEAGWEEGRAILNTLMGGGVGRGASGQGSGDSSPRGGVDFLTRIKTKKNLASSKELKQLLEIASHRNLGDVRMSLAQEFILAGHTDLAEIHAMSLLGAHRSFKDFCRESLFEVTATSNEKFFALRQCLQHYVPTTLRSESEATELREGLLELLRVWNKRLEEGGGSRDLQSVEPHADIGIRHVFLVVYQGVGGDDVVYREMVRLHRNLCPKLLDWVDVRVGGRGEEGERGKIRIGIISNNLRFHSVGRLLRGVFGRLSREKFELVLVLDEASRRTGDTIFDEFSERADKVVFLKGKIQDCQELLSGLELDVLVFGDIGMDSKTSFLAYGRYSSVQVAFWGHPVTSALDSIDYFVGGEHFGDFGKEFHEQLITFESSGVYWVEEERRTDGERIRVLERIIGEGRVKESTLVYVCPQSVMKLHPKFDNMIHDILEKDDNALVILLVDTRKIVWGERVVRRLGGGEERIVFVEQLPYDEYYGLVCAADVNLDPFPFGGGVTMLESLGCGVPIVTDVDMLKVFHLGNAWLELSGLADMGGDGSYTERALELAKLMNSRRRETSNEIKRAVRGNLFEDKRAVSEWEDFLVRAAS